MLLLETQNIYVLLQGVHIQMGHSVLKLWAAKNACHGKRLPSVCQFFQEGNDNFLIVTISRVLHGIHSSRVC